MVNELCHVAADDIEFLFCFHSASHATFAIESQRQHRDRQRRSASL